MMGFEAPESSVQLDGGPTWASEERPRGRGFGLQDPARAQNDEVHAWSK